MKAFIVTIFLVVAYGFCLAQNSPPPVQQGPPPTVEELVVAPAVTGVGKRSFLVKQVCRLDSDFVFKQREDVEGLPDLYASDRYNTSVEIIGREDSVAEIQWTFRMIIPNNGVATHQEIYRMGNFAGVMGGQEGYDWLSKIYLNFKDKMLSDYTETKKLFLDRVAVFKYLPDERKMTLTITVKKE